MLSWFLQSSRWKTSCCISAGASPVLHQPRISCRAPAGTRQGLCGAVKTLQKTLWKKNGFCRGSSCSARFGWHFPWRCWDAELGWAGLGWPHPAAKTRATPGDHPGVPLESIRPVLVVHICASFLIYGVCMHIESGHVSQFSVFVVKFRYNGSCEFLRCWWCEMGFALLQAEIKSPMH